MTHAVILAAGRGSRLRSFTQEVPKPLVELGGRTLLDRTLELLADARCQSATIVTGYRADLIEQTGATAFGLPIDYAHNDRWDTTGIVRSFLCSGAPTRNDDIVVVYGDIVFEPKVIEACLSHSGAPRQPGVAIPVNTAWLPLWSARMDDVIADAESLAIDGSGRVTEIGGVPDDPSNVAAQFMGIVTIGRAAVEPFTAFAATACAGRPRCDTTAVLGRWIESGRSVAAFAVDGGWLEVDTVDDLRLYRRLHVSGHLSAFCRLEERPLDQA